jgi:hypothetical protein
MSDYVSFGPPDDRAQVARRDHVARVDPVPPIPRDPVPTRMQPRPWSRLRVLGGVVAAALVAGVIATALGPDADETKEPIPTASAAPAAADGWRWDSYQGVRVLVPSNWAYALEPVWDWCRDNRTLIPRHPYVSFGATGQSVGGVVGGCRAASGKVAIQPPTRLWAAHVALDPSADSAFARTTRKNGWWVVRRPVGEVVVKAVSRDRTIADRIAASAEIIHD